MAAKAKKSAKARTTKAKKPSPRGAKKAKPAKHGRRPRAGKAWDGGGGVGLSDIDVSDDNNPRRYTTVYLVLTICDVPGVNAYPAPQLLAVPETSPLPQTSVAIAPPNTNVVGASVFALDPNNPGSMLAATKIWNTQYYLDAASASVSGPDMSMTIGLASP